MSALFYQNAVPQENQSIKCNDITVRGNVVAQNSVSVEGGITTNAELAFEANSDPAVSGKIKLPAMTVYTQLTSQTTAVAITGNEQQFIVDTFDTASIPAGTSITFAINNASIEINKTIVVMNKMGSTAALTEVNDFVSITAAGGMTITRHNFGTGAATGLQRLCFKLIQSL